MKITNSLGLPEPFVDAVTNEYAYTPKRYSATAILKGAREAILQRRHDDEIEQDVADMVWLIFGTAVHSVLENAQESETQLKENKIVVPIMDGYELSGIFDLYDDGTGTVTDYKTASVWKVIYAEWEDYRKQVLIYCWMLRQIGFDARRGEVVALLKDHSKTKAERDASYPQHPVHRVGWDFTDGDFAQIEEFIIGRFREIEAAESLPDDELPLCTEEERWTKPGKWAVMKKGRKSAVRLYDSKGDAYQRAAGENRNASGEPFYVEERPGEDGKCAKYCSVCDFCNYGRALKGGE